MTARLVSQDEFERQLRRQALRVALIGMSNCGKSYRSRQLEEHCGFAVFCVDDAIETAIKPELAAQGYAGISGLAKWMGFPFEPQFAANEARYLQYEEEITSSVQPQRGRNFALDTTGSVVYLSSATVAALREQYLVVHLEASDAMLADMTERYFATPKPVVWGPAFRMPQERRHGAAAADVRAGGGGGDVDDAGFAALRKCYPELLRWRRARYREMADVNVPAGASLSAEIDAGTFLERVRGQLPRQGARSAAA